MTEPPEYADPERYAELTGFHGEWRDLFWNRDFLELMARRWDLSGVAEALDVGCGAGHWGRTVLSLLPQAATMVSLDHEAAFFELARSTAQQRGIADRLSFVEGAVERMPFEDDRFDVVTCQLVLIHVADAAVAIREMIRVTKPGGLVILAEPDNRAGNLAHLNCEPALPDEQIAEVVRLQLTVERGKMMLGEGNNSVGALLPGLLRQAGLQEVRAHVNDRCIDLAPPYDTPSMKEALDQELRWLEDGVNILLGNRDISHRLFVAGGGREEDFERGWAAVSAWAELFEQGVEEGRYHAARGFMMYLVSGRKPAAVHET